MRINGQHQKRLDAVQQAAAAEGGMTKQQVAELDRELARVLAELERNHPTDFERFVERAIKEVGL